ncbi:MAG TPA: hypothetical protein VE153_04380 [Myxococcus sp.]|nr:hypothetical protein [Myxococcus sp.]
MRLPVLLRESLRGRRAQRGQSLVLGSLSFLVLALMVTLSFNLSHALRQKMSLQQHSDALAYSMAVLEARALNYYAVGNRAIAGSYVAMNSLHAYMAAASVTGAMLRASGDNFDQIALMEMGICAATRNPQHCLHAKEAEDIADDFRKEARGYDGRVRRLEGGFRNAMSGLDLMVDNLHAAQRAVQDSTLQALTDGRSHGLEVLTQHNAPGASFLPEAVGALNANEFSCAVDGMPCQGSVQDSSSKARARVMTEVANASRSGWPATRAMASGGNGVQIPPHLHPDFLKKLQDIPREGSVVVLEHKGTAKVVQHRSRVNSGGQSAGNEGGTVVASERGRLGHLWKDGFGESDYAVSVWSDRDGGGHQTGAAHSGAHSFEGVNAKALSTCAESGNCFMKFRANPSASRDWGQPRVYSYVTRQFRGGDPKKTPWELNPSGEVVLEHGPQGTGRLTLAPGEGVGLSKGLVYYHRFGPNGWREAPNLFSPYWRAKLHPFTPDEAARVLKAAGNADAAELARVPGVSL